MTVYTSSVSVLGPYELTNGSDTTTGSLAKAIKDYVDTLDSTTDKILDIEITLTGQMAWVTIVSGA